MESKVEKQVVVKLKLNEAEEVTEGGLILATDTVHKESRAIDKGIVVTSEGDLSVAVAGLIIKELCQKPVHFWENLMFDEEKNWVLGGHEGGSAGFSMAKKGTRPKLRNTQYLNFGHSNPPRM